MSNQRAELGDRLNVIERLSTMRRTWRVGIPMGLTLGNIACGCLGIAWLLLRQEQATLMWVALLAGVGACFDGLDGWAARRLDAVSDWGRMLDALADLVTFGVMPAIAWIVKAEMGRDASVWFSLLVGGVSVIFMMATAWRLWRFVRTAEVSGLQGKRSVRQWVGLPSTAAGVAASCLLVVLPVYVAMLVMLVLSVMMVSRHRWSWRRGEWGARVGVSSRVFRMLDHKRA